jgi:hypothetical protein
MDIGILDWFSFVFCAVERASKECVRLLLYLSDDEKLRAWCGLRHFIHLSRDLHSTESHEHPGAEIHFRDLFANS